MIKKAHIVIIPGWGGSHETWADFAELLQQTVSHVTVLDMPCFGSQACPDTAWGIEQYAAYIHDELVKMASSDPEPIVLLGHSFGGQLAAFAASKYPKQMNRLILVAPALYRPKRYARRFIFGTIAALGRLLFSLPIIEKGDVWAKKLLYKAADSPDYSETSGIKRDIYKKIIRQDLREVLPKISVPTHIIWGDRDTYVPVKWAKRACAQIPLCSLSIIPGGSHGLHLRSRDALCEAICTVL